MSSIKNDIKLYKNCYNLKLPKFTDIVRPDFKFPGIKETVNGIYRLPPDKIFNKEFLTSLEDHKIYPTISVLFYSRSNHRGSPHIDGTTPQTGPWSINWNVGSKMLLHYYKSDLKNDSKNYMLINDDIEKLESGIPESPFLLRNDIVHSVDNIDNSERWAITLRGFPKLEWNDLVDLLDENQLIINN
jgi:hypothetical protein